MVLFLCSFFALLDDLVCLWAVPLWRRQGSPCGADKENFRKTRASLKPVWRRFFLLLQHLQNTFFVPMPHLDRIKIGRTSLFRILLSSGPFWMLFGLKRGTPHLFPRKNLQREKKIEEKKSRKRISWAFFFGPQKICLCMVF